MARIYGWCAYHTRLSWGSDAGYPDDHFWHPGPQTAGYVTNFFVEAKKEGEKPTKVQQACIDSMRDAGMVVYVWLPSDWPAAVEVLSFGRARGV